MENFETRSIISSYHKTVIRRIFF